MFMNTQIASFVKSAASKEDFLRDDRHCIVFAGRSNVGKSSLINSLLNRKNFSRISSIPGKTTQINYFLVDNCYFVDLPGYGYARVSDKERRRWGVLMEDFFSDPKRISLGILIVDARHEPTADDLTMFEYFLDSGCPFSVVANKIDKLKSSERAPSLQKIQEKLNLPESFPLISYSCRTHTGREQLLGWIEAKI